MKIVENKNKFFLLSLIIIFVGVVFMIYNYVNGNGIFNYDVEFSGGTSIRIDIGKDFSNEDIEKTVSKITGQSSAQIQRVLNKNQVMIKIKSTDKKVRDDLIDELAKNYGFDKKSVAISDISATISNEMQRSAIIAVVLTCLAILIYISIRFKNIKTGSCAVIALLHDTIITILSYAVFRIPLNYSFIAVVLTILGYSTNATIVIFDRMRENKMFNIKDEAELVDKSVTQTMWRSLFTSLTTLLSIICLYFMGVASIKDFSLPIIIGIICGTYSSICIATSLWFLMNKKSA